MLVQKKKMPHALLVLTVLPKVENEVFTHTHMDGITEHTEFWLQLSPLAGKRWLLVTIMQATPIGHSSHLEIVLTLTLHNG
jgi:hypothetical protein